MATKFESKRKVVTFSDGSAAIMEYPWKTPNKPIILSQHDSREDAERALDDLEKPASQEYILQILKNTQNNIKHL